MFTVLIIKTFIMKNLLSLGKALNKSEQQSISGDGLSTSNCISPYFVEDGICDSGDYPHPTLGHCVCCVR
ncbi:hypothetical protein D7030_01290 [Flavobacteriaceae bacterium AU392]|nr:hypothetical protein D1817_07745 [Flavobacteriaceae bacterium]RKM86513.1 hypothetical protein D7030_01290 [Flavobacteriaceae bacterium AU392]